MGSTVFAGRHGQFVADREVTEAMATDEDISFPLSADEFLEGLSSRAGEVAELS